MRLFVEEHSLCLKAFDRVFILRPALSWDGRTGRGKGKDHRSLPWFKVDTWRGKTAVWHFFTVPYLAFGMVMKAETRP